MGHLGPVLGTLLIGTFPGMMAAAGAFLAVALVLLAVRYRARLKDAVDLDSVRDDLASVIHQTLEPADISVWISQRQ